MNLSITIYVLLLVVYVSSRKQCLVPTRSKNEEAIAARDGNVCHNNALRRQRILIEDRRSMSEVLGQLRHR
jgi:hypothetical protein